MAVVEPDQIVEQRGENRFYLAIVVFESLFYLSPVVISCAYRYPFSCVLVVRNVMGLLIIHHLDSVFQNTQETIGFAHFNDTLLIRDLLIKQDHESLKMLGSAIDGCVHLSGFEGLYKNSISRMPPCPILILLWACPRLAVNLVLELGQSIEYPIVMVAPINERARIDSRCALSV